MFWLGGEGAVSAPWSSALMIFAVLPLVTGLLGWCPLYSLLRISSRAAMRQRG
jgi:hypothetical protein